MITWFVEMFSRTIGVLRSQPCKICIAKDVFEAILDGSFAMQEPCEQAICKAYHQKAPVRKRLRRKTSNKGSPSSTTTGSPGSTPDSSGKQAGAEPEATCAEPQATCAEPPPTCAEPPATCAEPAPTVEPLATPPSCERPAFPQAGLVNAALNVPASHPQLAMEAQQGFADHMGSEAPGHGEAQHINWMPTLLDLVSDNEAEQPQKKMRVERSETTVWIEESPLRKAEAADGQEEERKAPAVVQKELVLEVTAAQKKALNESSSTSHLKHLPAKVYMFVYTVVLLVHAQCQNIPYHMV